jgi:hypothetical protein
MPGLFLNLKHVVPYKLLILKRIGPFPGANQKNTKSLFNPYNMLKTIRLKLIPAHVKNQLAHLEKQNKELRKQRNQFEHILNCLTNVSGSEDTAIISLPSGDYAGLVKTCGRIPAEKQENMKTGQYESKPTLADLEYFDIKAYSYPHGFSRRLIGNCSVIIRDDILVVLIFRVKSDFRNMTVGTNLLTRVIREGVSRGAGSIKVFPSWKLDGYSIRSGEDRFFNKLGFELTLGSEGVDQMHYRKRLFL